MKHLAKILLETGDKTLVEGTRDRFWGCGRHLHSDEVKKETWSGKNNMGKILILIREELKNKNLT